MSLSVSKRMARVKPSPTGAVLALATRLRAEGRDIINLGIGQPDFRTPDHIVEAGIKALRAALAVRFENCGPENIVVFNGSKQALYAAFQTLCNPGDQVIIPLPCWVSFSAQVRLAGAEPVEVVGERVEVRRLVRRAPVRPQHLAPHVVGHDEEDVRLFLLGQRRPDCADRDDGGQHHHQTGTAPGA